MPKLAVIIVSYNTKELTRNCLNSLILEIGNADNQIWVVDNNSSDCSVEMIKNEFPYVKIIENHENVGFARANNQVLGEIRADYYLLLNSDTIIPLNSIAKMLEFLDSHPQVAACSPRLINGNEETIKPVESLPSILSEIANCLKYHFFPIGNILRDFTGRRENAHASSTKPIQMEILSAACLILRKETIDKVGLLGEEYFLFSEENDYFTRMKRAKLNSYYMPNIEVVHLVGMSRKRLEDFESDRNYFKSRILYFNKYGRHRVLIVKLIYRFFFYWSIMAFTLWGIIKNNKGKSGAELYKNLLKLL